MVGTRTPKTRSRRKEAPGSPTISHDSTDAGQIYVLSAGKSSYWLVVDSTCDPWSLTAAGVGAKAWRGDRLEPWRLGVIVLSVRVASALGASVIRDAILWGAWAACANAQTAQLAGQRAEIDGATRNLQRAMATDRKHRAITLALAKAEGEYRRSPELQSKAPKVAAGILGKKHEINSKTVLNHLYAWRKALGFPRR